MTISNTAKDHEKFTAAYDRRNDGSTDADSQARADERRVAVPADESVGGVRAGWSGAAGTHDAAGERAGGSGGLAGARRAVAPNPPAATSAMWRQHYIERFAQACVERAQEHESEADRLRALAAKVLAPPPDTRVELTSNGYTIRFVKEVVHADAA